MFASGYKSTKQPFSNNFFYKIRIYRHGLSWEKEPQFKDVLLQECYRIVVLKFSLRSVVPVILMSFCSHMFAYLGFPVSASSHKPISPSSVEQLHSPIFLHSSLKQKHRMKHRHIMTILITLAIYFENHK